MTALMERPVRNVPSTPAPQLEKDRIDELGEKLDAVRAEIAASLGEADAAYIHRTIALQRRCEVAGRALLMAGVLPPAWLAGTALLSVAKILENMELGHNIIHGQWDWMNDPEIHSSSWEWDTASPSEDWKHSHNYRHHTFTNIVGEDRDVGYGILRMSDEQRWHPYYLLNPVINLALATFFQYGVALHDLEIEKVLAGQKSKKTVWRQLTGIGRKVGKQVLKDYALFPALAGPFFLPVLTGNLTANLVRNLWSHAIIFCGHFPDGAVQFDASQLDGETQGQWYVRQMMGSANLDGGPVMDLMSGHLDYQIEHHLFPDLPSNRYPEISVRVRALCEEYDVPYTTGPFLRQYGQVLRKINRLALP